MDRETEREREGERARYDTMLTLEVSLLSPEAVAIAAIAIAKTEKFRLRD